MNSSNHTISVIVVALNEENHIRRLKTALDRAISPTGLVPEIILVDGGSSDRTAEDARAAGFDLILELPGANIPVCRNYGAQRSSGDLLAYVDADCEVCEDWLGAALPHLLKKQPVILGWPVEPPRDCTWVQKAWHVHWSHKNLKYEEVDGQPAVRHEAFRLITTRNMLLTRSAYQAVDGFDEGLPTGEDTDFVFRACLKGIEVIAYPGLRVVHHGEPADLKAFYRQQLWHANRSSYSRILQEQKGTSGGNAPLFTALFLGSTGLAAAGLLGAIVLRSPCPLLGLLPLVGLLAAPAFFISVKAGTPAYFFQLCLIYGVYGFARSLDFIGFHRNKVSWKTPAGV